MSEPILTTRSPRIVPWGNAAPERPLAIAHRAGNDLRLLERAVERGADLIEGDIWPHKGRLEVRHMRTLWKLPFLWDRWKLARGWKARLQLRKLLNESGDACLMLDLKGHSLKAACDVLDLLQDVRGDGDAAFVVCSRDWRLLEPFASFPWTQVVHSVGTEEELAALSPLIESGACQAISIRQTMLTRDRVAELRRRLLVVMAWPVNSTERTDQLLGWGVNGIITDSLHVLRAVSDEGHALAAAG